MAAEVVVHVLQGADLILGHPVGVFEVVGNNRLQVLVRQVVLLRAVIPGGYRRQQSINFFL